jgi:hypothetical protein
MLAYLTHDTLFIKLLDVPVHALPIEVFLGSVNSFYGSRSGQLLDWSECTLKVGAGMVNV